MTALESAIGRRQVLKGFLIAGPTLAVAGRLGFEGPDSAAGAFPAKTDEPANAYDFTDVFVHSQQPTIYDLQIEVKPDGRVFAELPKQDIGQGIIGTFAMMVADNLDTTFDQVDVVLAPAEQKWGMAQLTGGSHSTRVLFDPVRIIGAQMRGQLLAAASEEMGVPVNRLRTENGHVVATDGRTLSYGALTARAAKLHTAPAALPKKSSEYKIIGKPQVKYEADKIAQGQFPYTADLHSSKEYLPTVMAMPATHGATMVSIDDSAAKAINGVVAVTPIPGMPDYLIPEGVAVTAETFGIAKKAKDALNIQWSAGPMDSLSDAQIDDMLSNIIDDVTAPGEGIDASFRWPYVPHAPMETNAAAANVTADRAEVWGGAQIPGTLQRQIAETTGLPVENVLYHVNPAGGAFGRHLFHDQDVMAAQISQRLERPVKLQWMREEDIKWGRCRPVSLHRVKAAVVGDDVVSWEHRMACPEMDLRHGLGDFITQTATEYNNEGAAQTFWHLTQHMPFKTGPSQYTLQQRLLAKPTAAWRNVYTSQVRAADEIVMDELARQLGRDELEFRIALADTERHRKVLETVGHEGQWGRQLPAGVAQGVALSNEYKSISAYLMEIDVRGSEPRMTRCTIAADTGYCINPTGTTSSLLGQAMDGFAVAFRAGLHIDNGATRESNFHDYKWTRMFDTAPEMDVHILPASNVLPGGVGELGVPAAAAAAANAYARATGATVRNFPINEYGA